MKVKKNILSKVLVSLSFLGLGILATPLTLKAESTIPSGYTLSKTPLKGQHCYYHGGGHVNYYCYGQKLQTRAMEHNDSMMKPAGSMSKPNNSMMMKPGDSMSKPNDSMSPNK
jgi:hypothetical protein